MMGIDLTGWQIALMISSWIFFFIAGWYRGLTGGYHLGKEATIKMLSMYMDKASDAHGINDGDEVTLSFSKEKLDDDVDRWIREKYKEENNDE